MPKPGCPLDDNERAFFYLCCNIQRLRYCSGYSPHEFCHIMQISPAALDKLAHGNVPPRLTLWSLFLLAEHFKFPLADLFCLKQSNGEIYR